VVLPIMRMGARPYLPTLQRFGQPDPVEGGAGPSDYAYPADPVNSNDITGMIACGGWWRGPLCASGRAAKSVGRGTVATAKAVGRGAVAAARWVKSNPTQAFAVLLFAACLGASGGALLAVCTSGYTTWGLAAAQTTESAIDNLVGDCKDVSRFTIDALVNIVAAGAGQAAGSGLDDLVRSKAITAGDRTVLKAALDSILNGAQTATTAIPSDC
jgi:hypothetical protein